MRLQHTMAPGKSQQKQQTKRNRAGLPYTCDMLSGGELFASINTMFTSILHLEPGLIAYSMVQDTPNPSKLS
eukprot:TRINITY_DN1656_c0_g1_i1.p1 TRINITY_DN1656_c0_g1~~TRINITY_DN1656_c0_g1_i1.p1  ORF type:complete len:72 (+),score=7.23 TRINITY_DN1656_c0_g1_i1:106-321(+)